ncbi:MAG: nucleotidyl transferase AbiEii/AbiGii toxin family protein [Candidatus Hadarchaeaceae archaeon]
MLTKEELIEISKATGLKPHQQEKHYVQTLALRFIYSEIGTELIFKGGTALWFFHGLNRFSNDLDFTLVEEVNLDVLVKRLRVNFELLNFSLTVKKVKDDETSFSFRIGVEGPLFTKEIERCFVSFEISKRERVIESPQTIEVDPPYPDVLPFTVPVMGLEEISAENVRAILTRNYARDLYDLWFLVRKKRVEVRRDLVGEKLRYYGKKFAMGEFREKLEERKGYWESELKPLILGTLPDFKTVEREVLVAISKSQRGK